MNTQNKSQMQIAFLQRHTHGTTRFEIHNETPVYPRKLTPSWAHPGSDRTPAAGSTAIETSGEAWLPDCRPISG